jgi:hypothetical protein
MRAVIYARYSSDNQREASLEVLFVRVGGNRVELKQTRSVPSE